MTCADRAHVFVNLVEEAIQFRGPFSAWAPGFDHPQGWHDPSPYTRQALPCASCKTQLSMSSSFGGGGEPLRQRSQSQNNALAIRIVPYSPPRPSLSPSEQADATSAASQADDLRQHDLEYYRSHRSNSLGLKSGSPVSRTPVATPSKRLVSGPKLRPQSDMSRSSPPCTPAINPPTTLPHSSADISAISHVHAPAHGNDGEALDTTSSRRPPSRRRNLITVHPNSKTFSLGPHADIQYAQRISSSSLSNSSSLERLSSDLFSEGRPSTPLTALPERSVSPCFKSSPTLEPQGQAGSSPWNYRLVGGLRKVPETPDLKRTPTALPADTVSLSFRPSIPDFAARSNTVVGAEHQSLSYKASFQSSQSASTGSETTNYKVYAAALSQVAVPGSDACSLPSSTSDPNYEILGRSSPPIPTTSNSIRPSSAGSDANYIVHGTIPSSSASSVILHRRLRSEYSQESLVVPPLRTAKKRPSDDSIRLYKSRSRESFRRGSFASVTSVLGGQDALRAAILAPIAALYQPSPSPEPQSQPDAPGSSSYAHSTMMYHPHQWSAQLSTVASESEGGSALGSRSISPLSAPLSALGRRSPGFPSNHSRHLLGTPSSPNLLEDDPSWSSQSALDGVDRPAPSYNRAGTIRLVRDQDEHGDGLADLHQLHQRPSRRRLSSFLSNSSLDRNLHSSGSSRANSLSTSSLPAWARLYYGSGEQRRWLRQATSLESMLEQGEANRPLSSFHNAAPVAEQHLPVRGQNDRRQLPGVQSYPEPGLMDITSLAPQNSWLRSGVRKQTSSIWSPHLGRDQRASGYSIWNPPPVGWQDETSVLGRRKIQIVLFIAGFVFPLAWLLAAFLPLPQKFMANVVGDEQLESAAPKPAHAMDRHAALINETRYENARWWRNLNRCMAVIGLLILAVVIALAVVGVRQGWGRD